MLLTILILEDAMGKKLFKKLWTNYVDWKTFNTNFEKYGQMFFVFFLTTNQ